MKAKIIECNPRFFVELEAETIVEAAQLVRLGMYYRKAPVGVYATVERKDVSDDEPSVTASVSIEKIANWKTTGYVSRAEGRK